MVPSPQLIVYVPDAPPTGTIMGSLISVVFQIVIKGSVSAYASEDIYDTDMTKSNNSGDATANLRTDIILAAPRLAHISSQIRLEVSRIWQAELRTGPTDLS